MQTLADAGELPVVDADQQSVSGTQAQVYDAWATATTDNALVPYLDWGTPEAYDLITVGVQSFMGGDKSTEEFLGTLEDGVKADRWRILVGSDAQLMDRMVREDPEHVYEADFFARFASAAGWHPGR